MKPTIALPALLACLSMVSAHAQSDGVGRADKSAKKQINVDLQSCAKPVWPKESLRREETGRVTLEFLVGLDGKVLESKVLKSSGFLLLDLAAQDGLAKCQFTLPSSVGRTEPTRTQMQYVWTLEKRTDPPAGQEAELQAEWQRNLAAAEQGDANAQWRAGMEYLYGRVAGEKNPDEGLRWLRAAAEQGHERGMISLAYELKHGLNVQADPQQSLEWLEKAAAKGSAGAEFGLAMSLLGPQSVQPDETRARALLEKALAGGNKSARTPLARLLLKENGANAEGLRLLQAAVDDHDRVAQFMLGEIYEKGEQVPADRAKALALYERAAAGGFPYAQTALARLKQQNGK